MPTYLNRLFLAIGVLLFVNLSAFGQVTISQVAAGVNDEKAEINNLGDVIYYSSYQVKPGHVGYNLWEWSDGTSQLVAGNGQQAQGLPAGVDYSFSNPVSSFQLNNSGEIAFSANVSGTGAQGLGTQTWIGVPGALNLIPGVSSFSGFESAGNLMVNGTTGYSLVGLDDPVHVVGKGDPAPGTNNLPFTSVGAAPVTGGGYVAFDGQTTVPVFNSSTGIWSNYSGGLWEYSPSGSISEILQSGQQATGLPPGINFGAPPTQASSPSILAMSNDGNIVFGDNLYGTGTAYYNNGAYFAYVNHSVHLLFRVGDPVRDFAPFIFQNGFSDGQVNDEGQVAFIAPISGQFGMFRWENGQLNLLMWHGEYAPGFNDQTLLNTVNQMFMDSQGRVFFTSNMIPNGVEVSPITDTLWMVDPEGQLHLLLEAGVPVDVDGQSVTFNTFDLTGINDNGQVLLNDPSGKLGLFLLNAGSIQESVPEPAGVGATLAGLGWLLNSRRSRQCKYCGGKGEAG